MSDPYWDHDPWWYEPTQWQANDDDRPRDAHAIITEALQKEFIRGFQISQRDAEYIADVVTNLPGIVVTIAESA